MKKLFRKEGCKPSLTAGSYVGGNGPNLESDTKAKSLRVANLQGLKRALWLLMNIILMMQYGHCQITLQESGCIPSEGDEISSLENIHLESNLSTFFAENPDVDASQIGIVSNMSAARDFQIYKGIGTEGTLLYSGYKKITNTSVDFRTGNVLDFTLENIIQLQPNEDYTLYFPYGCFYPATNSKKYTSYVSEDIFVHFKGQAGNNALSYIMINPEGNSELKELTEVYFEFNQEIVVNENINIYCYEGTELVGSSSNCEINSLNPCQIVINFDNIPLYSNHSYRLIIPENAIIAVNDNSLKNSEIIAYYNGKSFHPVETGRIYPSNNSVLSWLSQVKIPFKFDEGYNLGRSDVKAKLYKGSLESEPTVYDCSIGSNMTDLLIDIWDFNLEPSTTYNLVIEEGQVVPTASDNISVKLLDTSNHDIVLTYTTPEVLASVAKTNPTDVTPSANAEIDNLGQLKLTFQPYTFDGADYVVEMTEGAKATLSDGTAEWTAEMSYEGSEGGESYAYADFNIELIAGKDYKVTIPAGTFYPYAHTELMSRAESAAIEIVFIGTTPAQHSVVISSSDGHTTKTIATRHQDVVLAFEAPEGRNIESVTLNEQLIDLNEGNYTIKNITEDAKFHITLNKVEPEVVEPQYVNVYLEVGDHVAVTHKVAKEKDATVNVAPTENWILSKLTLNDADVTEEVATDGNYTIPAASLANDANLKAEFAYNGTPMFDFTTGVNTVEGCDYKVYSDNSDLVIENVPANARVAVYSVAGLKIAEESNHGDTDMIRISLNPGVYVVIINNDALKVRHQ